jgi:hypothetical protein
LRREAVIGLGIGRESVANRETECRREAEFILVSAPASRSVIVRAFSSEVEAGSREENALFKDWTRLSDPVWIGKR